MKNLLKIFRVISLVAIIGLSMAVLSLTGCDNGTTTDGGGGGGGGNKPSGLIGAWKWTYNDSVYFVFTNTTLTMDSTTYDNWRENSGKIEIKNSGMPAWAPIISSYTLSGDNLTVELPGYVSMDLYR